MSSAAGCNSSQACRQETTSAKEAANRTITVALCPSSTSGMPSFPDDAAFSRNLVTLQGWLDEELSALRSARAKLTQVENQVNGIRRDRPTSQLRATHQIKRLVNDVLQLFGANEGELARNEPNYGWETAPREGSWGAGSIQGDSSACKKLPLVPLVSRILQAPFKMKEEARAVLGPGRPSIEAVVLAAARILPLGLHLVVL